VPAESVQPPAVQTASVEGGRIGAHALAIDRFGNVQLDATMAELASIGLASGSVAEVTVAGTVHRILVGETYADVPPGALILLEDSSWRLALGVNAGHAASRLEVGVGGLVRIGAADE
jgi:S-adenosylmethionine hydrolase